MSSARWVIDQQPGVQAEQQDGNHDARVQKMSEQMKDARKSLEEEEHKEEHHEEYEVSAAPESSSESTSESSSVSTSVSSSVKTSVSTSVSSDQRLWRLSSCVCCRKTIRLGRFCCRSRGRSVWGLIVPLPCGQRAASRVR